MAVSPSIFPMQSPNGNGLTLNNLLGNAAGINTSSVLDTVKVLSPVQSIVPPSTYTPPGGHLTQGQDNLGNLFERIFEQLLKQGIGLIPPGNTEALPVSVTKKPTDKPSETETAPPTTPKKTPAATTPKQPSLPELEASFTKSLNAEQVAARKANGDGWKKIQKTLSPEQKAAQKKLREMKPNGATQAEYNAAKTIYKNNFTPEQKKLFAESMTLSRQYKATLSSQQRTEMSTISKLKEKAKLKK